MLTEKEKTKQYHVIGLSLFFWVINLKIFLLLSNWSQTILIWKYSKGVIDFYSQMFSYYTDFVITIPPLTSFLTLIFAALLFFFWYYYFQVYFHKLPIKEIPVMGVWGIISTLISFLGFGCVACGQTLLTSVIFLFVSNTSMYFAHFIGNFVIVIGILFLSYGVYRNYKIFHNKNICKI